MDVPYTLVVLITLIFCIALAFKYLKIETKRYKARPFLLTKAELNFFNQLNKKLPSQFHINCKVRLSDICTTTDRKDIASFNRITSKHIDFVITKLSTAKTICAIELDDKSHNSESARRRDAIKNSALNMSGVELFRVKSGRNYTDSVTKIVNAILESDKDENDLNSVVSAYKPPSKVFNVTQCPKCPSISLDKVEMKFPNKGSYYFQCNTCGHRVYD